VDRWIGIGLAALKSWLPLAIAAAAFAVACARIDDHGFWFDEAYSARLAIVDGSRCLAGAMRDIHPPGWPLLLHLFAALPLPVEEALRLPAALSFAALVGLVARRSPFGGVALCFHTVLFDHATQARPYATLALGVAAIVELAARRRWVACGIVSGIVASLHALAPAIVLLTWVGAIPRSKIEDGRIARLTIPALVLVAPWLPTWLPNVLAYAQTPWYEPATASAWWNVTDGIGGLVGWIAVVAIVRSLDRSFAGTAIALFAGLAGLTALGVGVEIGKLAAIFPALLVGALGSTPRARVASALVAAGFLLTSVRHDARPDLREAAGAVAELGDDVPVVSVFASEAGFYFRGRPPIPSYEDSDRIVRRVGEVLREHDAPCVAVIALPGTFPIGLSPRATADVSGLDVRLVGTERCAAPLGGAWRAVSGPQPSSASP
jgi:hypothetical protein